MNSSTTDLKREQRVRRRKVALAGTALLASVGLIVGGAQSAFQSTIDTPTSASIASVDLTANGDSVTHNIDPAEFADIRPGETRSYPIALTNGGTTGGTLSLRTFGNGVNTANQALVYELTKGGAAYSTGNLVSSITTAPLLGLSDDVLAEGETETYDLEITLPQAAADNNPALSGLSTDPFSMRFTLTP